jgi:hypothetical protein
MPLPPNILAAVNSRRFWTDLFWITETSDQGYPHLAGCKVDVLLSDGGRLSLSIDEMLCSFSLEFAGPGRAPVEIAWDDQAHWHPHVLRWTELDAICRVAALQDAKCPHPGVLLLLLCRFAPICVGDEIEWIVPTLEQAWRALQLFSDNEIREFIERLDARDAGFTWRQQASGNWCLTQEKDMRNSEKGLYTLRSPENTEFPFSEWERIIAAIVEALPEEQRENTARIGRTIELRQIHNLNLTVPMQDAERPLPSAAGYFLGISLERLLAMRELGTAEISGSCSTRQPDGKSRLVENTYSVQIKGDLHSGVRAIREALWWARFPEATKLTRGSKKAVPLHLKRDSDKNSEPCLQLAALRAAYWKFDNEQCFRLDRVPLLKSCRVLLKSKLVEAGGEVPNDRGWSQVDFTDGGRLRVRLATNDEARIDTVGVIFDPLSETAAKFIHRLMVDGGLMLLPLAVAATDSAVKEMNAPWPPVRVVKHSAELFKIIARGPFAWWSSAK